MDWVNEFGITMSVDVHGRHHKGRGVDGGQFTEEDSEGRRGGSASGSEGVREYDTGREKAGDEGTGQGSAASARFAEVKEELTSAGLEPLPKSFKFRTRDEIGSYSAKVIDAARSAGHLINENEIPYVKDLSEQELGSEDDYDDGKDIGGSEHRVYIDEDNNRVYKITRGPYYEGVFGLSKDAHDYLRRLEIAAKLWPSLGYKFEGVIDKSHTTEHVNDPSAVIATSMNRISGVQPTKEEISKWFTDNGWVTVGGLSVDNPHQYVSGWIDTNTGVIISDTHPGNFLKTSAGLVPIDVNIREDQLSILGTGLSAYVGDGRAMSLTPAQQALWANDITRDCLLEAGDDVDAGLAAAEYIISTQPMPAVLAKVSNPPIQEDLGAFLAYDIHNRDAQGILNRALRSARKLSVSARKELAAAIKRGAADRGDAILKFIDKYRLQLARLLTTTQLAALLEGAWEVAVKVPPLGEVPVEGLPVAEQEAAISIAQAANRESIRLPDIAPDAPEAVHLVTIDRAVRDLSEKNVMDRARFDALDAAARAKAFTVAGVEAEETLTKIRDALAENVARGADYETFRKEVLDAVDEGTFLSDAHQETVFRTNVQSAFSDGQASVLAHPLVRSGFPYSTYDAIHDDRVRANHLALERHGIGGTNVYRNDDPVFQLFRPPWDYSDRCSWTPMTIRQAAERGIKEAQAWLDTGVEPAQRAFVDMPPFSPPPGFQRALVTAPLSIQLSMRPMGTFGTSLGWITVGGRPDPETGEKHVGGVHIQIDEGSGQVRKGPPGLKGEPIGTPKRSAPAPAPVTTPEPITTPLSPSFEAKKEAVKAATNQALGKTPPPAPASFEAKKQAVVDATDEALGKTTSPTKTGGSGPPKAKVVSRPDQSDVFNRYVRGDKSSEKILAAASSAGGKGDDKFMDLVNKEVGFDAKPQLVSKDELDKHIAAGGVELYRGVGRTLRGGGGDGKHTQYVEQFKSGDFFAGTGMYGNGTYVAVQTQTDLDKREGYQVALRFAGGNNEGMMRMSLKSGVKSVTFDEVQGGIDKDITRLTKESKTANPARRLEIKREAEILSDHGRWAQLHGYDVIKVVSDPGLEYADIMVVLNRGAVLVQKEAVQ